MSISFETTMRPLSEAAALALQKHLYYCNKHSSNKYTIGSEKDFADTAVKISSIQLKNFEYLPTLPERSYLVASLPYGLYPINECGDLEEYVKDSRVKWKVLTIPRDLYKMLFKSIDFEKGIIYTKVDDLKCYDNEELTDNFINITTITTMDSVRKGKKTECNIM